MNDKSKDAGPRKLSLKSAVPAEEKLRQLKRLFPACVTEAKGRDGRLQPSIDFDLLRQELSDRLIDGPAERYQLGWPGKREAIALCNSPCAKSFSPQLTSPASSDAKDWVKHHACAQNLFIEGDNLDALKLLREIYLGRIKAIYIDPPYNTGKDFVYQDNWKTPLKEYLRQTGQLDENGKRIQTAETNGRQHSRWLSMMYPRLYLARNLLSDNGVIFISIDDHESHNLRHLMDEIFGQENFIAQFVWHSKHSIANDAKMISANHENVICYCKDIDEFNLNLLPRTEEMDARFVNPDNDPRGKWSSMPLHAKSGREEDRYQITFPNGVVWDCPSGSYPTFKKERMLELYHDNRLWFGPDGKTRPRRKAFLTEVKQGKTPSTLLFHKSAGNTQEANAELRPLLGRGMFENPKPVRLIEHLLRLSTSPKSKSLGKSKSSGASIDSSDEGDIVMDFFAGSCTTAHAVMKLNQEDGGNRRFIMVQLPEPYPKNSEAFKAGFKTIADVGKERIARAAKQLNDNSGFRVLKIGDSNFKDCSLPPEEYKLEDLEDMADNLLPNRKPLDLLLESMLILGLDLHAPLQTQTIQNKQVFFVADNQAIACFEEELTEEFAQALVKYKPRRVVFLDGGFASDAVRINIEQLFQQLSPATHFTAL